MAGRRLAVWAAAGLVAGLAAVLLSVLPLPSGRELSPCLYRQVTGMPCPGCGLTRAADRLADGDLAGAVAAHPLAPLLALEAALGWLLWGAWAAGRWRPTVSADGVETVALAHLALLAAVWLGRAATGTLPW